MSSGPDRGNGLLEFLRTTAPYEWFLTWPDWAKYVAGLLVVATLPAILESYRIWVRKLLSAALHRLKRLSPKSVISNVREKRRVRRVRRRGRLEAADRMSRAEEILPYLHRPGSEKLLRKHGASLSDSFMEARRLGHGTSVILRSYDLDRYQRLRQAEIVLNPISRDGDSLWLLDDGSVIVEGSDGAMEVASREQAEWAQRAFLENLESHPRE